MPNSAIGAFEKFLQWGPIGLAGLMLVLVIFALVTSELTKLKAALLSFFMIIGAGCFGAALYFDNSAEHAVTLIVLPNDMENSGFPPPVIKRNGQVIDHSRPLQVAGTTALTIDVNRGFSAFRETDNRAETATAQAAEAEARLEHAGDMMADLQLEVSIKEAALVEANQTITQQTASLEEALETGNRLAIQVDRLRTQVANTNAAPPLQNQFQNLEREILRFNEGIRMGISPGR